MNLLFFDTLYKSFPKHRLIISDFDSLPDTIPGYMAPVVQTRFNGGMVPCSTYMVQQGWFDIFFPTDFELLKDMHSYIGNINSISSTDDSRRMILTQRDFLKRNADLIETRTRSGEIPMLMFYKNFKFLLT
jgi:hypothetical protein